MIQKHIKVTLKPELREAFIAQQRVWNDAMLQQPGFLGVEVATDPDDPAVVFVMIAISSRACLDRFMDGDHDRVMEQTNMQSLYERLEIHILDVVE